MTKSNKSYRNLQEKVWDEGICSGCGACVAVCPTDALYFPEEAGISHPISSGYCKYDSDYVSCGACYNVCPRTEHEQLCGLGPYTRVVAGQATKEIPHRQSGGAVTSILVHALDTGLIDGVVTVTEDRWTHRPISYLITSTGEVAEHAGSRYNWGVPVLYALKTAVIERKLTRVAIVGTPCVVQAARRMVRSDHDLLRPFGRSIRLIIGLFCTETFDYNYLVSQILDQKMGIAPYEIVKMNIKRGLDLTLSDGTVRRINLHEIEEAVRYGCKTCIDFSAIDADISAGAVGSPKGWTTLVIRNESGDMFVKRAKAEGVLRIDETIDISEIEKLASMKLSQKK